MARLEGIRGVIGFVETVAAGSFAAAARTLGVTPVAVSKNVQRLERKLGVRLLQRSTREIAPLPFVVCAAPSYPAAHGKLEKPAALARHNCLRLSRAGSTPGGWTLGAENTLVDVKGNFIAGDIGTLAMAAAHGQGVALLPLPLVLPMLRDGLLAPVLTHWLARPAMLFIHYPNRKGL